MPYWLLSPAILFWCVAVFFCLGDYRLRHPRKSLPAWLFFISGWLAQFCFIYLNGIREGRCPVATLPEILTFLSWATAGIYLLINLVYRSNAVALYVIGAVSVLQGIAMLLPSSSPEVERWLNSSWLGFHASLSVMAYGAFGVSSILAGMYLFKERQIKSHQLAESAMTFPAMTNLELWMTRIVFGGFCLFSIGLFTGFLWFENLPADQRAYDYKICWAVSVWAAYLALILGHRFHWLKRRIAAWLTIGVTGFTLLSFWGINTISTYHRF